MCNDRSLNRQKLGFSPVGFNKQKAVLGTAGGGACKDGVVKGAGESFCVCAETNAFKHLF